MKYKAIEGSVWMKKADCQHVQGPDRVSTGGSLPTPSWAYELKPQPTIEITDHNGRTIRSNYFYGQQVTTMEEAEAMVVRLEADELERREQHAAFRQRIRVFKLDDDRQFSWARQLLEMGIDFNETSQCGTDVTFYLEGHPRYEPQMAW